jgi:hypothetical protein
MSLASCQYIQRSRLACGIDGKVAACDGIGPYDCAVAVARLQIAVLESGFVLTQFAVRIVREASVSQGA